MPASDSGLVTLSSPHSFETTLTRVRQAIAAKGITLFLDLDQAAAARSSGLTMPPAHLLLFGNPRGGTQVMLAEPQAGLDLPLKAWIWASSGGQVFVTYNDPAWLAARYNLTEVIAAPLAGIGALLSGALAGE